MLDDVRKAKEEEYFRQREQELIDNLRATIREEEVARVRSLAVMHCPKCGESLEQIVFHEVPIERCPHCQGIWLDAGELELVARREYPRETWLSRLWKFFSGQRHDKRALEGEPESAADAETSQQEERS